MPSPIRAIVFLIFVAIPLLEIVLLIKVGQLIGFWWTVLIVIGTAALGTSLLHRQGLETLRRMTTSVRLGTPPVQPLVEGALLLGAGALLLTPGLITDALGLLLLVPPIRSLIARAFMSRMTVIVSGGFWQTEENGPGRTRGADGDGTWSDKEGPVIEGEFERLDEREPRRPGHKSSPRG